MFGQDPSRSYIEKTRYISSGYHVDNNYHSSKLKDASCGCTENGDISPWDGEHWDSISNFPAVLLLQLENQRWLLMAIGGFVIFCFFMKPVVNIWNLTYDISFNRKCLSSRNIIVGYPNPFVQFSRV